MYAAHHRGGEVFFFFEICLIAIDSRQQLR
jgi:hypothetical protein